MQLTWLIGAPNRPASVHRRAFGRVGLGSAATQLMRAVRRLLMAEGRRRQQKKRNGCKASYHMNIAEAIARCIAQAKPPGPMLVAFDGVDTSGKSFLADQVFGYLARKAGLRPIRVSIDGFHYPRERRLARGSLSPEGYFYDSYDLAKLQAYVIDPIRTRVSPLIGAAFDYRRDESLRSGETPVTDELVVLFDGIFLHRDELFEAWDYSFFLEVSVETVLRRAMVRDLGALGSLEEVMRRYQARYIPGQELYLRMCRPKERADVVIDNNDWDRPVLLKGTLV